MKHRVASFMFGSLVALAGCATKTDSKPEGTLGPSVSAVATKPDHEINPRLLRRFRWADPDAPAPARVTAAQIQLGRMLYFDTRLSKSQTLSCNSCHPLTKYGVDGTATSVGHKGKRGRRNAPSVYNAAGHFQLFWDGRAADVETQALGPIADPTEMGSNQKLVLKVVNSMPGYVRAFEGAFPGEQPSVSWENVGRALGAFERQLVTKSRFDKYLAGDLSALTQPEKDGLRVFLNSGCMVCHTGPQIGAAMFQRVGAVEPWPNQTDLGRYEVTKQTADRMMFKVPSLKNVEKTAPYFHDGSAKTLRQAILMMGKHQLGLELSASDAGLIETWMKSLTGELPSQYLKAPELPPSTPETPGPQVN